MFRLIVLLLTLFSETGALAQSPPWTATATTSVITEQRTFEHAGARLSGTLYVPAGGRSLAAVVVAHGASSPLRTSPLYRHLTELLPSLGVAVFLYDRRGSGASTGEANTGDFALLADDAIAAVRMLKSDHRIDPRRIGVWGLSQGGWLSLMSAARSHDVRFVVSISAPVVTPDVQMLFSSANALRVNGYSQADIDQMTATRLAVDNYMRGTVDHAVAQARVDAARGKPWFKYLYMGTTIRDRAVSGWRKEIETDPLTALAGIRVPTLILFGATDPVVPVAASVKRLRSIVPLRPGMSVAVVAGADHGMQTDMPARDLLDPAHADESRPNSTEYFGLLAGWLTSIGVARPPIDQSPKTFPRGTSYPAKTESGR